MRNKVIPILTKEIEYVFARKVNSSRDCLLLSEEVFHKTGMTINPNTLRRFFGLVKWNYPPSAGTLEILAKYCGCQSIEEVLTINHEDHTSMVFTRENILHYLVSIFKEIKVKSVNDETFLFLVRHTIIFINRNPQLIDEFQREVAKTKNGQEFYFEQFVNIDKLDSYYGDGLRYYVNEKSDAEAKVFAHSLLVFRYWLTGENEKLEREYSLVCENKFSTSFHPFVSGRYFATCLYHAHVKNLATEKLLQEAYKVWSKLTPGLENYRLFPCFEYVFGEALVLTGHYQEALMYIQAALKNYPEQHSYVDVSYYEKLKLWEAFTLVKTGNMLIIEIELADFHFLSKKYATILYLLMKLKIKSRDKKMRLQLNELVNDTGFKRLAKL